MTDEASQRSIAKVLNALTKRVSQIGNQIIDVLEAN
jgi:DNA-directed RNA polymerase specialized sigma subunit